MPDLLIELPGGPLDAYLVPSDSPSPAIVLLAEAYGLNDDIRSLADRAAGLGYTVVAPDLLEGGRMRCLMRAFSDLRNGGGPIVDRGGEVVEWLMQRPDVEGDRVGVVGFCLGGGLAFLMGLNASVKAVAPNYGKAPSDELLSRSCPVVGSWGGRDKFLRKDPPRVAATLEAAGVANDLKVYPDAGHSFANRPDGHTISRTLARPYMAIEYNDAAAEDTWARIGAFFGEHV